jgi:hypothetical protein
MMPHSMTGGPVGRRCRISVLLFGVGVAQDAEGSAAKVCGVLLDVRAGLAPGTVRERGCSGYCRD